MTYRERWGRLVCRFLGHRLVQRNRAPDRYLLICDRCRAVEPVILLDAERPFVVGPRP